MITIKYINKNYEISKRFIGSIGRIKYSNDENNKSISIKFVGKCQFLKTNDNDIFVESGSEYFISLRLENICNEQDLQKIENILSNIDDKTSDELLVYYFRSIEKYANRLFMFIYDLRRDVYRMNKIKFE